MNRVMIQSISMVYLYEYMYIRVDSQSEFVSQKLSVDVSWTIQKRLFEIYYDRYNFVNYCLFYQYCFVIQPHTIIKARILVVRKIGFETSTFFPSFNFFGTFHRKTKKMLIMSVYFIEVSTFKRSFLSCPAICDKSMSSIISSFGKEHLTGLCRLPTFFELSSTKTIVGFWIPDIVASTFFKRKSYGLVTYLS